MKTVLGLGLGGGLLYLALNAIDLEKLKADFANANYWWVAVGLSLGLLSHWFRAVRWKILLNAAGHTQTNTLNLFYSIMTGYMVNQAVPRAGEISRGTLTSRSERIPLASSFGTLVTDRIFDFICLGLILLVVILSQYDQFIKIIEEAFAGKEGASEEAGFPWLMVIAGVGALGLLLMVLFRKKLEQISLFKKIFQFIADTFAAVKSVRKMEQPVMFVLLTVGIWVCYVMMTYLTFFALEKTSNLPFIFGLTAFAMGGIGMVIPSPGGIGSYHYAIGLTFAAYGTALGYASSEAALQAGLSIAFIIHGSQMLMLIAAGFICYLLLIPKIKVVESEDAVPASD